MRHREGWPSGFLGAAHEQKERRVTASVLGGSQSGRRTGAGGRARAGASGSWAQAQAGGRALGARQGAGRAAGRWARGRQALGARQAGAGRAAGRRWARGRQALGARGARGLGWPWAVHSAHFRSVLTRFFF